MFTIALTKFTTRYMFHLDDDLWATSQVRQGWFQAAACRLDAPDGTVAVEMLKCLQDDNQGCREKRNKCTPASTSDEDTGPTSVLAMRHLAPGRSWSATTACEGYSPSTLRRTISKTQSEITPTRCSRILHSTLRVYIMIWDAYISLVIWQLASPAIDQTSATLTQWAADRGRQSDCPDRRAVVCFTSAGDAMTLTRYLT